MKLQPLVTSLIIISLCYASYKVCGQDAEIILNNSFTKCQSVQNGWYEMTKYMKFMSNKDTNIYSLKCYFKKSISDSIYSFKFHNQKSFNGEYIGDAIYTGDDFVLTNSKDCTAVIRTKSRYAKDLKLGKHNHMFFEPLTSKMSYPFISDSGRVSSFSLIKYAGEEVIGKTPCYHITVNINPKSLNKNQPDFSTVKMEYQYWISKNDSIPLQYTIISENVIYSDTLKQFEKLVLTNYELNSLFDDSMLTLTSIPSRYKIKTFEPNKKSILLPLGSEAPDWRLNSITGETVRLQGLRGKIVLLDFFYKSCYPCMLSIPKLVKLYEKYKEQGLVVIGVDPVDKVEDLVEILTKKKVTYPILLGAKGLAQDYHVSAYPTVYLIDKTGKVFYHMVGYGPEMDTIMENYILEALNINL